MRLLFVLDPKDHDRCTRTRVRPSARSIILRDGRVAMVHSVKYDFYKFPGGGIEAGESPVEAMIRETREESGLVVDPDSVRPYGYVHRIEKTRSDPEECFVQDNFYYLCDILDTVKQDLDPYEAEEAYILEFVEPCQAIRRNRSVGESPYSPLMFEREARVLELLMEEGLLPGEPLT